jgi:hypothetical protein
VKFKKILLYLYIYNRVGEMSSSAASAILFDEIGAAIRLQQQIRANHARKSEEASDAKALADGDSEDSETGEDDSSATDDDSEEDEDDVDVEEASDSDSEEDE